METSLRNIGNSKGAVIPAKVLKELKLDVGDKLEAKAENGRLIITPVREPKPKYTLDQLLAKCDDTASIAEQPMPQELSELESVDSVGLEI